MALDIYAWLAQRLHRVPTGKPATISWPNLHFQFAQGYSRLVDFRRVFLIVLREVLALYKTARIDLHAARNPSGNPVFEPKISVT
jgi:hypothetical protein